VGRGQFVRGILGKSLKWNIYKGLDRAVNSGQVGIFRNLSTAFAFAMVYGQKSGETPLSLLGARPSDLPPNYAESGIFLYPGIAGLSLGSRADHCTECPAKTMVPLMIKPAQRTLSSRDRALSYAASMCSKAVLNACSA
jgi:hypothetical protein